MKNNNPLVLTTVFLNKLKSDIDLQITDAAVKVCARLTMDPVRNSIQQAADNMLEFVENGKE